MNNLETMVRNWERMVNNSEKTVNKECLTDVAAKKPSKRGS